MPNHVHLILSTPEAHIGKIMQKLMVDVTKELNRISRRSGYVFQGPYYRTLIENDVYYQNAVKYVLRNPVKAGLCEQVQDWPYSSLQFLMGNIKPSFQVSPPLLPIDPSFELPVAESFLAWLNSNFRDQETAKKIRDAFRKVRTNKIRDRKTRRPLEEILRADLE